MKYLNRAKVYCVAGMLAVCFIDTEGIWMVIPALITMLCFWSMYINLCRYDKYLARQLRMERERRMLDHGKGKEETESA